MADDKREQLVRASLKLMLQEGIRSLPIGRLSRELGVSTKTLYQHFGDKPGLVRACVALYRRNSLQVYQQAMERAQDSAEVLLRFHQQQVDRLLRTHPAFFRDIAYYLPEESERKTLLGEAETRQLLQRGQAEGLFQAAVDAEVAAATLTLLMEAIFEGQRFAGHGTRELMTQVLWPYWRGLCTAQGLEAFRQHRENYLK